MIFSGFSEMWIYLNVKLNFEFGCWKSGGIFESKKTLSTNLDEDTGKLKPEGGNLDFKIVFCRDDIFNCLVFLFLTLVLEKFFFTRINTRERDLVSSFLRILFLLRTFAS